VSLDVLAEDAGSFIEWDTENPDAEADRLAGLEAEYDRGWQVLEIITMLARASRRLAELGHTGGEANFAHYDTARQLCLDGLRDIEKQMNRLDYSI
jgi:hypothetical protein